MALNTPQPSSSTPAALSAISPGTIMFVLFKHKWTILLATFLALGGAAAYYFQSARIYKSQAKILVIYVLDRDAIDQVETTSAVSAGRGGDAVVNSEIEILTSWDLAEKVVEKVGPDRFLKAGGSAGSAASAIINGLTAIADKGSNVIRITYQHSDPDLTKLVLEELIRQYFVKHRDIHRSAESLEKIQTQVGESSTSLGNLEEDLKKLKGSSLPLAQLTANYDAEIAKVKDELDAALVALAEQRAWVNEVQKFVSADGTVLGVSPTPSTEETLNSVSGTIGAASDNTVGAPPAPPPPIPDKAEAAPDTPVRDNAIVAKYQSVLTKLAVLQGNSAALVKYTPENRHVKDYEARLKSLQEERLNMETKFPYLLATRSEAAGPALAPRVDLMSERGKLASLEARIAILQPVFDSLKKRSEQLAKDAPAIGKKERDREIEKKNFDHLLASQVKADANSMVPSEKMPGLGVIQEPTPPAMDSARRDRIALAIAGGGPVLGAALALLFGLLLNRTIKRPLELEEHLGVSLMMAIPFFRGNGRRRLSLTGGAGKNGKPDAQITPWRENHFIRPFAESIRDRLGIYFERNKLKHKPKLIGVTGYSKGAGVSTLAGGLAVALSEVGDGRVLLVDMNASNGKAHSFSEGLPVISLQNAIKDDGQLKSTAENLYLARAENTAPGAGSLLLKKLFELMPNLKSSDFDYIVFDLPLLSQTSPAAAMGGLMDTVLMVVEAEANPREDVKRGHRDLIASGANVSTIFNKARTYGPRALVGGIA